jgi:hypothetical protein
MISKYLKAFVNTIFLKFDAYETTCRLQKPHTLASSHSALYHPASATNTSTALQPRANNRMARVSLAMQCASCDQFAFEWLIV